MNIIGRISGAAILLLISQQSFSAVIWSWVIDNPNNTVNSMSDVTINATIYNDLNSETLSNLDNNAPNEVVDIIYLVGSEPSLFANFTVDEGIKGAETIRSQFSGVVINPGESFSFVFYTLVPTPGGAATGYYQMTYNVLNLTASSLGDISGGAVNVTVVPVPAAAYLFFSSVILLAGVARRNSALANHPSSARWHATGLNRYAQI